MSAESDIVERALGEALGEGHVVTGWVLAVTHLGPDGQQQIWINTSPDVLDTTVLGLLDYATQRVRRDIFDETDV